MTDPTNLIAIYRRSEAHPFAQGSLPKSNLASELMGIPIESEIREWLTEWWQP